MSDHSDVLHGPFLGHAGTHPARLAVLAAGRRVSYGELAHRTAALAVELVASGVGPGSRVAVVAHKGWEQIVAALAVVRAGAAYVPIDAGNPPARVAELLRRADPTVVATDLSAARQDGGAGFPHLVVPTAIPAAEPDTAMLPVVSPADLAYVIFTSGSTGQPKGVMVEHVAAMNTINEVNDRFSVGPADRVYALSSLAFDLSVYDVFGTLAVGGTVVVPGRDDRTAGAWHRQLTEHGVTVWNSVPALMSLLVEHAAERGATLPPSLRLVLLSGDWIPLALPDRIRALAPQAEVVSLGGATEASIWSILYPVDRGDPDWRSIPYGRAMRGQTVEVLGSEGERPAAGETGEIVIGGAGLARGYWQDAAATELAFGAHPRTGARLYRTGDLGRYLPDGTIELLGRRDHQVKIHGYRIELAEVEHAMERHPGVHAAAVRAVGDKFDGRRLIGYYRAPGLALVPGELRTFLAGILPSYLVPAALVPLDALPLSSNGKVDRAALPWPVPPAGP